MEVERNISQLERDNGKTKFSAFFPCLSLSLCKSLIVFSLAKVEREWQKKKNERDPQSKRIPAAMESEGRSDTTEQTFQVFLSLSSF